MKKKTTTQASKTDQSAIKAASREASLKKSGQTTQIQGHLKAVNQRNQSKRDARG